MGGKLSGSLSRFRELQLMHAGTMLSGVVPPPFEIGMTCSA